MRRARAFKPAAASGPVFTFEAEVWLYSGQAAWHFVTLPKELSQELNQLFGDLKRGWGSLKVRVTLGQVSWETSIFPDKEQGAYILPLKAAVRKQAGLAAGDRRQFILEIIV